MKAIPFLFILLLLTACVQVNYVNDVIPITQKHLTIAILPPQTSIERKIWMSGEKYAELTTDKQLHLQSKLIKSFEKRMNIGECFVAILDQSTTNSVALLDGLQPNPASPASLCRQLHVDAVIQSTIDIREPVSEATAFLFQRSTGTNLVTNSMTLNARLIDTLNAQPLWSLSASKFGYLGSIKSVIENKIIRRTTRNTPYNLKKNPYKKLYVKYTQGF
jgi:hypothetical protein